jgi:hypothetical protein
MVLRALSLSLVALGLMTTAASAQDSPFAVSAQAGTTGIGLGVRYEFSEMFVFRAEYDQADVSEDFDSKGVTYNGKLDFKPFTFAVDAHPFNNSFFVSGGLVVGDRNINLNARPMTNTVIGGISYTPTQIGSLKATTDLGNSAPFVGLGYDNTFRTAGSLSFRAVVGAIIGKEPKVKLTSDSVFSSDPGFQQSLRNEERELSDDVDALKTYPVLQLGLAWRF